MSQEPPPADVPPEEAPPEPAPPTPEAPPEPDGAAPAEAPPTPSAPPAPLAPPTHCPPSQVCPTKQECSHAPQLAASLCNGAQWAPQRAVPIGHTGAPSVAMQSAPSSTRPLQLLSLSSPHCSMAAGFCAESWSLQSVPRDRPSVSRQAWSPNASPSRSGANATQAFLPSSQASTVHATWSSQLGGVPATQPLLFASRALGAQVLSPLQNAPSSHSASLLQIVSRLEAPPHSGSLQTETASVQPPSTPRAIAQHNFPNPRKVGGDCSNLPVIRSGRPTTVRCLSSHSYQVERRVSPRISQTRAIPRVGSGHSAT
jgi:hypothetical protein